MYGPGFDLRDHQLKADSKCDPPPLLMALPSDYLAIFSVSLSAFLHATWGGGVNHTYPQPSSSHRAPAFDPLFLWLTFSFEHSWPWRRAGSQINGELKDPRAQSGHGHWSLLGPTLVACGLCSFGFLETQPCSILLASSVDIRHPDSHPPSQDCFSILDFYPSHD